MNYNSRILIAGSDSFYGIALVNELKKKYKNLLVLKEIFLNNSTQKKLLNYLKKNKPEYVFISAGLSRGIKFNYTYPYTLIKNNLIINDFINTCFKANVKNLLYFGSSCCYPKSYNRILKENYLFSGKIEETSRAYAASKIAGMELCRSISKQYNLRYISAIPSNVFGPHDNFEKNDSHFIAATIRKVYFAKKNNTKSLEIWGSGKPKRDFIFIKDFAKAAVIIMKKYNSIEPINISSNFIYSTELLTKLVLKIAKHENCKIKYNHNEPDGMKYKVLSNKKLLNLNKFKFSNFENSLQITFKWFKNNSLHQ